MAVMWYWILFHCWYQPDTFTVNKQLVLCITVSLKCRFFDPPSTLSNKLLVLDMI